ASVFLEGSVMSTTHQCYWSILGMALLLGSGCSRSAVVVCPGPEEDVIELDGKSYRISGPFGHENLAVFLLHSLSQDEREFITLDQGLKEGSVKVTEKAQEQVAQLEIENRSDSPLVLQEGDRLEGGKQDRIIIASLVVPANSGKMPVPTNCIEEGRWVLGRKGGAFDGTHNAAFAPREVRAAAKVDKSQE